MSGPSAAIAPPARAAGLAGVLLLALYVATIAPGVTFWDAGEFISAIHGYGVPHPPGTPLYVTLGRVWTLAFPAPGVAVETNLLSAVCTASAGAILAWLITRWTHNGLVGVAAAVCAGAGFTVWASATETEVYASSLLLMMVMMLAASAASRPGRENPERATLLLAYLLGLAGSLHPSALLAAPAAALLAAQTEDGATDWLLVALLSGVTLVAAGTAVVSPWFMLLGVATIVASVVAGVLRQRALAGRALAMVGAVVIGATPWIILYLRAQHDPALNQGNPSELASWLAVVRRDQYAVSPLWPRNAPVWMQVANIVQYADWQFGIGLAPTARLSIARLAVSAVFVSLGIAGAIEHRERHRPSWRAMVVLLLAGTLGAAAQLNLRAGPSIGYGILPPEMAHEPRERDYFFALGFWVWGAWVALGAWRVSARLGRARRWAVVAIALVPVVLNWPVNNRRGQPESHLPRAFAAELLRPLPLNTVLFVAGDNDTYPLWYLQQVENVRRDVVVITIPLLGAGWYRDELHRRHGLAELSSVEPWRGTRDAIARISALAVAKGRDVAADVSVASTDRAAAGAGWTLWGMVYLRATRPGITVDERRVRTAAENAGAALALGESPSALDDTPRYIRSLLQCPSIALADSGGTGPSELLASTCNFR